MSVGPAILSVVMSMSTLEAADDGKRTVDVPRFGIKVRVPQAWSVVDWNHGRTAFELDVPQDARSLVGHVRCTLEPALESLEQLDARLAAEPDATATKTTPGRKLYAHRIVALASPATASELVERFTKKLTLEWEFDDLQERRWRERRIYVVEDGLRYTFTLDSDEAHFDAYAADFEEMFAAATIGRFDLGMKPLAGGYWMQPQFRFAMKLPEGWKPTLGPNERTLLFAVGTIRNGDADQLSVQAAPLPPRNLEQLKIDLPAETAAKDPTAKVDCEIVRLGTTPVLETITRTKVDGRAVITWERRFATAERNYELRIRCEAAEFEKREAELRAVLDSFQESPQPAELQSQT